MENFGKPESLGSPLEPVLGRAEGPDPSAGTTLSCRFGIRSAPVDGRAGTNGRSHSF